MESLNKIGTLILLEVSSNNDFIKQVVKMSYSLQATDG